VAVLGGGMSGLTAAHELIERGFDVTVYESTALGGKARSIPVPGTGTMGRTDLPGEHGFRFFPGFYHNVPDTMSRIPLPGNGNSVTDNLVSLSGALISRSGGRSDIEFALPTNPGAQPLDPNSLRDTIIGIVQQVVALPLPEVALFADRLLVFMTSSPRRREGQWENVAFWDFMRAEGRSREYQVALVRFMTRGLIALKERVANTRTVYGKTARECTRAEVLAECWAQLQAGLHDTGRTILPDSIRHSSFLDPAIRETGGGLTNDTPLFINLATMESANESGRQAVNALLDAAGATDRVPIQTLYQPPELEPLKRVDAARYAAGLPNLFDLPG
jgi:uncharacterized protein with NAD-binding domain and iron-sulfur cluster